MIGFLHLPKTGGTAVRTACQRAGLTVWLPKGGPAKRYQGTDLAPAGPLAPNVDMATGHLTLAALRQLHPTTLFTVLREPVDAWLSHYYALERIEDAGTWHDPDTVPSNIYTRLLGTAADPLGAEPDVDAALEALATFDHIGHTQALPLTFQWLGVPGLQANVGQQRRSMPDPPAWLRDAAHDRTRLDAQVYRAAAGS